MESKRRMQLLAGFQGFGRKFKEAGGGHVGLLVLGTALALLLRSSLLDFRSVDYRFFTRIWYDTIRAHGLASLAGEFSNYNPPYLYVIYLVVRFLPNVDKVAAIKIPSILADLMCAGFVYQIVRLKNGNRGTGLLAYMAVLFAPVVILNGAFWGQADSIYTAGLVACVYFLLAGRKILALVAFAGAFIFKLQAVFLLPLLIALWWRRELALRYFLAVPIVYLVAILPAWLVGRPLASLLTIYFSQVDQYKDLAISAPNLYSWLPAVPDLIPLLYPAGMILAAIVVLAFLLLVQKGRASLTPPIIVELAAASCLIVPFVLPRMHQRYFFPADVLSIAFGFYFPAYFYIPLVLNVVSYLSYQYFLFGTETFSMWQLALATLVILLILVRKIVQDLYPASLTSRRGPPLAVQG
jgi:Gpi18-like mannosyltransferase